MDDSTSHEARADAFPLARKGYDRRQVDAYREASEARIDALEQHIESLEGTMNELGLARSTDLAAELDTVGEEVKRVLQEARVAAEQMRSRAADDAARWRAEADEESRALRESSRAAAYEARGSVWEAGREMLASAAAASETVTAAGTERALFTQAEAEREASRLVGDARRERDESIGGAGEEAEQLVSAARQEAESILSSARRQVDAAQERARALEVRRAELMTEMETARATIAGNEAAPEPDVIPEAVDDESAETAAVVEEPETGRTHWPDDEGSVKIVSADRVMSAEPVDADAMVAEIEAMRTVPTAEPPATSDQLPVTDDELPATSDEPPATSDEPPATGDESGSEDASVPPAEGRGDAEERSDDAGGQESDGVPVSSDESGLEDVSVPPAEGRGDAEERSDDAGGQVDREPGDVSSSSSPSGEGADVEGGGGQASDELPAISDELPATDDEPGSDSSSVPPADGRGDAEERSDDAGGQESDELPASSDETETDPLVGLFAQLREPATDETSPPEDSLSPSELLSSPLGGGADEGGGGGQESDQSPATPPDSGPATRPETDAETVGESDPGLDPFALRERHLLPVQNRALRSVKRYLVEAQNRALEDLRLTDEWESDASVVSADVSDALADLARESMVAGFAAAAEMMDTAEAPQPEDAEPGDPAPEFASALLEAVQISVNRSRGTGAGHRETAASLSRIFRSWRTDEAERRVQFASRSAYHVGVAAALADLGAGDIAVASSGRPCRECPANKGPWAITDGPPSGTVMPPARLECACTIVPSR